MTVRQEWELPSHALGMFVKSPDPELVRVARVAGLDYVVVDLEHSGLSLSDACALVGVLRDQALPTLVRITSTANSLIGRLLEAGSCGVQLASTTRRQDIEQATSATRYPPHGTRGVSRSHRSAQFGLTPLRDLICEPHPVVIAQIESAATVDPLPALLQSELGGVFIGTEDLQASCIAAGTDYSARLDEIIACAEAASLPWGIAATPSSAPNWFDRGAQYVTVGADYSLYAAALRACASESGGPQN